MLKGPHNNARKVIITTSKDQQIHDLVSDTNSTIKKLNNYMRSNFHHKKSKKGFRKTIPLRMPFLYRYQIFFHLYLFSCNNFGHKEIDCRGYVRHDYMRNKRRRSNNISRNGCVRKSLRSFNENFVKN